MNATNTPNIVLGFGKYAGYSTARLASHDPRYLFWLTTLPGVRAQPKLWAAVRAHVLANLLAELEVEMYGDLA